MISSILWIVGIIVLQVVLRVILLSIGFSVLSVYLIIDFVLAFIFAFGSYRGYSRKEAFKDPIFHRNLAIWFAVLALIDVISWMI